MAILVLFAFLWLVISFFTAAALAQPTYVGSAKCESCHKGIYDTWKDTLHNKSQQELSPANDAVVVDWRGIVKLPAWQGQEVSIKLNKTPEGGITPPWFVQEIRRWKKRMRSWEPMAVGVEATLPGEGGKQSLHPAQSMESGHRPMVPYNLQNWYDQDCGIQEPNPANSFEAKCAGCHNKTASSAEAGEIHTHDFDIIKPSLSFAMFKKDPKMVIPIPATAATRNGRKRRKGMKRGQSLRSEI